MRALMRFFAFACLMFSVMLPAVVGADASDASDERAQPAADVEGGAVVVVPGRWVDAVPFDMGGAFVPWVVRASEGTAVAPVIGVRARGPPA